MIASGTRWVRPIRSILCLLDDATSFPSASARSTADAPHIGHRFLSSGPITIDEEGSYAATLEDAKVMLDPAQRAEKIRKDAEGLAQGQGYLFEPDDWLVTENAGLVEWPVVLMGRFDKRFMNLPEQVLRSAMRTHQRYFTITGGVLQAPPRLIMVANTDTADGGAVVRAGNERVLRARLADARFFWDQDTNQPLEKFLPALKGVVFHARLGSMKAKAERIALLARTLCIEFKNTNEDWAAAADPDDAERAGLLCKADLVTEMVGEFPDLQGVMGRYYALYSAEELAVGDAIRDHYSPRGPGDTCPTAPVSVAVALADKLDTLAGFFAIDERPTGSKDPFALRRAALGVIWLILENRLRLPLGDTFKEALGGYGDLLPPEPGAAATPETLLGFFADRLKVHLREEVYPHDLVSAAIGGGGEDDLVRLLARADALERFLKTDDGTNLLTAYRRAANILRIEEKKDGMRYAGDPDPDLFKDAKPEEQALYSSIAVANAIIEPALEREVFEEAMEAMASLRAPVDAFFDNVTVNCDDPALRRNRLLMLSQIRSTLDRVADFSKIEG